MSLHVFGDTYYAPDASFVDGKVMFPTSVVQGLDHWTMHVYVWVACGLGFEEIADLIRTWKPEFREGDPYWSECCTRSYLQELIEVGALHKFDADSAVRNLDGGRR